MIYLFDWIIRSIQASLNGDCYPVDLVWTAVSVFLLFIGWSMLYKVLCYVFPKPEQEWHCRIVTFIHAIVICFMCFWSLFLQDRWPFDPNRHASASTPLQQVCFMVCLSYFFFDFSWCLLHGAEGPVMLLHHSCSILGIGVALFVGRWGTELAATIGGAEASNPLLQLRWFLRAKGHRNTLALNVTEVSFMFLFGAMRFGLGSVLLYIYLRNPRTDFLGRLAACIIYGISLMFWVSICSYARHRIFKTTTSGQSCAKNGSASRKELKKKI